MMESAEARRPVNIDKDLLAILCCPDTKQDVSLADAALIAKLNEGVRRGQLKNKANKPVAEPLDGGLIRSDRKILYPIREDIPVMLIEEGIPLEGMI
ncbi:MAG: Trm112 family protein [Nitrospiraceae bacterium]